MTEPASTAHARPAPNRPTASAMEILVPASSAHHRTRQATAPFFALGLQAKRLTLPQKPSPLLISVKQACEPCIVQSKPQTKGRSPSMIRSLIWISSVQVPKEKPLRTGRDWDHLQWEGRRDRLVRQRQFAITLALRSTETYALRDREVLVGTSWQALHPARLYSRSL